MSRLLKLFVSHLLKKVRGDAIPEYLKVFKSVVKFYGKCMLITEGKEVPSTTLSLYQVRALLSQSLIHRKWLTGSNPSWLP